MDGVLPFLLRTPVRRGHDAPRQFLLVALGRGVQRVENPINPPESDRPEAQRVDPKSIVSQIRFYL